MEFPNGVFEKNHFRSDINIYIFGQVHWIQSDADLAKTFLRCCTDFWADQKTVTGARCLVIFLTDFPANALLFAAVFRDINPFDRRGAVTAVLRFSEQVLQPLRT